MKFQSFGLSDIGLARQNNEDVWIALPEAGFFALADGMGGHQAGEIAAKETLNSLIASIQKVKTNDPLELTIELRHAIEKANLSVYRLGKKEQECFGMGTTLCCLIWSRAFVIYAHVGDSRIYRFRNNKLELLTQDHSLFAKWVKTGKKSQTPYPYKNVITRAVGTAPKANPEISICKPEPGDLFFLCSDGLSDVLSTEEIEKIIFTSAASDLEFVSKKLIQEAKFKGSCDNITILMIQSEKSNEESLPRQQCDDSPRSKSLAGDAAGSDRSAS